MAFRTIPKGVYLSWRYILNICMYIYADIIKDKIMFMVLFLFVLSEGSFPQITYW